MTTACTASQMSAGPGDVCARRRLFEAAQMLDLRAGVPNVTCVCEREIKQKVSFLSLSPLRLAVLFSLARVCDVWDGRPPAGSKDDDAAVFSGDRP